MNKFDKLPTLAEKELLSSLLTEEDRKKQSKGRKKEKDARNALAAGGMKGKEQGQAIQMPKVQTRIGPPRAGPFSHPSSPRPQEWTGPGTS